MKSNSTLLLDVSLSVALVVVLALVVFIDHLLPDPGPNQQIITNGPIVQAPKDAKPLKMAMTPSAVAQDPNIGMWEDMADVLDRLGEGYAYDPISLDDLRNPKKLSEYDVLFFTCGNEGNDDAVLHNNLRAFVADGGTLYASDWRYECIAKAFPEFAMASPYPEGDGGDVIARVLDPGLKDIFGNTIDLHFRLNRWKPASFAGSRVTHLLTGEYKLDKARRRQTAPLLSKFNFGKGTVIFTSFHNERNNSDTSRKLLKYLVFSVVTAKEHAEATKALIQGGFSPQKNNLFSASTRNQSVSYTYENKKEGALAFVLAFQNAGATLRLTVEGPDGRRFEREGHSTFQVEVPNAQVGEWRYTVTALVVPYPDFPFTLTVAESQK